MSGGRLARACRLAIYTDMVVLRSYMHDEHDGRCQCCGHEFDASDMRVHHSTELLFTRILKDFVFSIGYEPKVTKTTTGLHLFKSKSDRDAWVDFHHAHAILKMVCKTCHTFIHAGPEAAIAAQMEDAFAEVAA